MKKILAAVLAAAMALSMSAVAFAKDTQPGTSGIAQGSGTAGSSGDSAHQTMGLAQSYVINPGAIQIEGKAGTPNLSDTVLGRLMNDNVVVVDLSVTAGKNELTGVPKVSAKNGGSATMSVKFKDKWGTGDADATMRIRITAKKDVYYNTVSGVLGTKDQVVVAGVDGVADTLWLPKGDTITLEPFAINADYNQVTNYGENMTVTNTEVGGRYIVANGEELYNNADSNDKVIIYFKNGGYDVAAYEVKVAANQKSVNVAFNNDEIADLATTYDDLEFEFISFEAQVSGANKFNNSGVMYFNAIGGDETAVYEYVDGTLTKLNGKYDSVDKTIAVSGIKHLTSYVVASEELPSEEEPAEEPSEQPSEPADTTPTNPGTGAL